MSLDAAVGPAYVAAKRSGQTEQGAIIRGAGELAWKVSEIAKFAQSLSVERSSTNVRSVAETALSATIA